MFVMDAAILLARDLDTSRVIRASSSRDRRAHAARLAADDPRPALRGWIRQIDLAAGLSVRAVQMDAVRVSRICSAPGLTSAVGMPLYGDCGFCILAAKVLAHSERLRILGARLPLF